MDHRQDVRMNADAWKGLLIVIVIGLSGYRLFFHESDYAKRLRTSCEARGQTLVKRPNAIDTDTLPYPLGNYHYTCSHEDIFGKPMQ
jgi:hypothetical protein